MTRSFVCLVYMPNVHLDIYVTEKFNLFAHHNIFRINIRCDSENSSMSHTHTQV